MVVPYSGNIGERGWKYNFVGFDFRLVFTQVDDRAGKRDILNVYVFGGQLCNESANGCFAIRACYIPSHDWLQGPEMNELHVAVNTEQATFAGFCAADICISQRPRGRGQTGNRVN